MNLHKWESVPAPRGTTLVWDRICRTCGWHERIERGPNGGDRVYWQRGEKRALRLPPCLPVRR